MQQPAGNFDLDNLADVRDATHVFHVAAGREHSVYLMGINFSNGEI